MNKKAFDAVTRARTRLVISHKFYGALALNLILVESTNPAFCSTMAVDGRHMWYWPEFVLKITPEELVGVVMHEVTHCAYKHMTRRGTRHPTIWNWAGDYVINADLKKIPGVKLPEPHLYDPQYEGMSSEEIYARIYDEAMSKVKTLVIKLEKGSGKGDDGGSDGEGLGSGEGRQGLGKLGDMYGCGGVIDAAPPSEPAQREMMDRQWDANVRMAVAVAKADGAGTIPGNLQRLVEELHRPKVNWRERTRNFIDGHMSREFSYARPNRRYLGQGMILPGTIPDALNHLVFLGDVSGSINDVLMKAFVSEVGGALDDGVADKITLLYYDAAVHEPADEFVIGDIVKARAVGGGGTDYLPPFKWVMEKVPDASCIVNLTDMMPTHWNLPDPDVPVLWAAFASQRYIDAVRPHVPFGEIIHVDGV